MHAIFFLERERDTLSRLYTFYLSNERIDIYKKTNNNKQK